jgi:hypothetical protein
MSKRPVRLIDGGFINLNAHLPASQTSFEKASEELGILRQDPEFEASTWGFTLTEDLGITFVDCDHRLGTQEADVFIAQFKGSYVEESASGNVHGFVLGSPGFTGQSAIFSYECYTKSRYVSVTGKRLQESSLEIVALPEAMNWFSMFFVSGGKMPSTKSSEAEPIHLALVQSALMHIDDFSYDFWFKVGAAMSHDHRNDGFEVFHEWSKRDVRGYRGEADCQQTYDSARRKGSDVVTCRSILHQAKKNGWDGSIQPDVALNHIIPGCTKFAASKAIAELMSHGLAERDSVIVLLMAREGWKRCKDELKRLVGIEANKIFRNWIPTPVTEIMPVSERHFQDCFPDALITRNDVKLLATIENLSVLLRAYGIQILYNVIKKTQTVTIPGESPCRELEDNANFQLIVSLCNKNSLPAGTADHLINVIAKHATNPILDWIQSTDWDGQDRLGEMCDSVTVSPLYREARNAVLKTWFLQCVAAADAGEQSPRDDAIAKFEYVLVLQGLGGTNKTSWISSLVPKSLRRYIKTGHHLSLGNKDTEIEAISHWITELGELDSTFRQSDISKLKAFTSKTDDVIRLPYERKPNKYPRRTSFVGSVNPVEFLVDQTGNRRYLVLGVESLNWQHNIDLQQFWAQVFHDYLEGEQWWPDDELDRAMAAITERHQSKDSVILDLEDEFDLTIIDPEDGELFSSKGLAEELFKDPYLPSPPKIDNRTLRVIGRHLDKLGFQRHSRQGRDKFRLYRKEKLYPGMLATEGPKIERYCQEEIQGLIAKRNDRGTSGSSNWRPVLRTAINQLRRVRVLIESGDIEQLRGPWKDARYLGGK